ncbi:MAG TPA: hypothetical protein VH951_07485 [Dehalococcoidia bacterium]|jgi:hypothetical protein
MADVHFSAHAEAIFASRGTDADEITEVINQSSWVSAGRGRLDCRKDFDFDGDWNGKHFDWKQVRPVFIEDAGGVTVLTVYTYFGNDAAPPGIASAGGVGERAVR